MGSPTQQNNLISLLRNRVQEKTVGMLSSRFVISSIYKVEMVFRPNELEPPFVDTLLVVQTAGTGVCCCLGEIPNIDGAWIGTDVRISAPENRCVQIAMLDAAYSQVSQEPTLSVQLAGNSKGKSEARALLAVSEVSRQIAVSQSPMKPRVTLVGAVGTIIARLVGNGYDVSATDLDPSVVGCKMSGVAVEDGALKTIDNIIASDVALVSGSTITSDTMGEIFSQARLHDTKLIFYAQTGSNFAEELLELGASSVISERFPFYMLPGISPISIFRR